MEAGCTWTRLSHASVSMGPCSIREPEAASTESNRRMQIWSHTLPLAFLAETFSGLVVVKGHALG